MNTTERCDKACEILRATTDGNDLDPNDLYLLQEAVNDNLTEYGWQAFDELCGKVREGYIKPYLHGIEHLTIDHEGFVYWKGQHVEHYNQPWAYSKEGKTEALEVARRCKILEAEGKPISTTSIIWTWNRETAAA